MFCTKCGNENTEAAKFCMSCGATMGAVAPAENVPTPPLSKQDTPMQFAGFWRRGSALAVDGLLIFFTTVCFGFAGGFFQIGNTTFWTVFSILYAWGYFAFHESGKHSATIGKRFFYLKVATSSGEKISFASAAWRYFCKAILFVGFAIQPFTTKRQALHDLLAGSVVVQTKDGRRNWVIATNLIFPGIALVGIIVATAIPAYQTATSNRQSPGAPNAQPQSNNTQEMAQAAREAVAAYKESGVNGITAATQNCYRIQVAQPFSCAYLDIASRHVDQQMAAALNMQTSLYFGDSSFGDRITLALMHMNINQEQADAYRETLTPEINRLVEMEMLK